MAVDHTLTRIEDLKMHEVLPTYWKSRTFWRPTSKAINKHGAIRGRIGNFGGTFQHPPRGLSFNPFAPYYLKGYEYVYFKPYQKTFFDRNYNGRLLDELGLLVAITASYKSKNRYAIVGLIIATASYSKHSGTLVYR